MAIFNTDLEAFVFIIFLTAFLYIFNRFIKSICSRIQKISNEQINKFSYASRVFSIIIIVYYIIEGFPYIKQLDPEYLAVVTGLVSTAIAFATSETFANLMGGFLIILVDPFEVNDIVKIKNNKGIIKSIKLTRVVMETFDHVIIEIYNKEVVSSIILNYTLKLERLKNYNQFKKQVFSPQDIGNARLDIDLIDKDDKVDTEMIELYKKVSNEDIRIIHTYRFIMRYPYKKFRVKIYETGLICDKYQKIFGFKPRFHIFNFGYEISVKFRIVCLDPIIILNNQRLFAKDIYNIIMK